MHIIKRHINTNLELFRNKFFSYFLKMELTSGDWINLITPGCTSITHSVLCKILVDAFATSITAWGVKLHQSVFKRPHPQVLKLQEFD